MGMPELAHAAWLAAAAGEEQVAPRLETLDRDRGSRDPSHQCRVVLPARRRVGQGYQLVSGGTGRPVARNIRERTRSNSSRLAWLNSPGLRTVTPPSIACERTSPNHRFQSGRAGTAVKRGSPRQNSPNRNRNLGLGHGRFLALGQVLDLPHALGEFVRPGDQGHAEAASLGVLAAAGRASSPPG